MTLSPQEKSIRREVCYLFSYQRLFGSEGIKTSSVLSLGLYYSAFKDSLEEGLQKIADQDYCKQFTLELTFSLLNQRQVLTEQLSGLLQKWKFDRLARVDQVLLLLGASELLGTDAPPLAVVCNEYTNLAKKYGHEESSAFINGVLETFYKKYGVKPS